MARHFLKMWPAALSMLAFPWLMAGCGGATTHEVCGSVLETRGSVEQMPAGQPVGPGSTLCRGTTIRTGSDASADVALLANALVHLLPQTSLEVTSLTLRKDGNETDDDIEARAVNCRLSSGSILISHRGAEGVAEFAATTPHGTVIGKFSCLALIAVDAQRTRITCANGMMTFLPGGYGASVEVAPGFSLDWPSASVAVRAAESSRGQEEIAQGFELESRLEALLKTRAFSAPLTQR
jgi:hypothetical protein